MEFIHSVQGSGGNYHLPEPSALPPEIQRDLEECLNLALLGEDTSKELKDRLEKYKKDPQFRAKIESFEVFFSDLAKEATALHNLRDEIAKAEQQQPPMDPEALDRLKKQADKLDTTLQKHAEMIRGLINKK